MRTRQKVHVFAVGLGGCTSICMLCEAFGHNPTLTLRATRINALAIREGVIFVLAWYFTMIPVYTPTFTYGRYNSMW